MQLQALREQELHRQVDRRVHGHQSHDFLAVLVVGSVLPDEELELGKGIGPLLTLLHHKIIAIASNLSLQDCELGESR